MHTSLQCMLHAHKLTNVIENSRKKYTCTFNSIAYICKVSTSNSLFFSHNQKNTIVHKAYIFNNFVFFWLRLKYNEFDATLHICVILLEVRAQLFL